MRKWTWKLSNYFVMFTAPAITLGDIKRGLLKAVAFWGMFNDATFTNADSSSRSFRTEKTDFYDKNRSISTYLKTLKVEKYKVLELTPPWSNRIQSGNVSFNTYHLLKVCNICTRNFELNKIFCKKYVPILVEANHWENCNRLKVANNLWSML